jgi:signal peptidase II
MNKAKVILIISIVLLLDQVSKFYIKTNFQLQESVEVFTWFEILFVENDGMAWGAKLSDFIPFISDRTAKLILTLFRIVAVFGIGYWLLSSIKKSASKILIVALSLIFAGAFGNIIDSVFYGIIFSESYTEVATFFPEQGYDTIFHGKVVDMLHFPMWSGQFPDWLPFIGGKAFLFFEPVFNIADIAISTGIGLLLAFNKRVFNSEKSNSLNLIN